MAEAPPAKRRRGEASEGADGGFRDWLRRRQPHSDDVAPFADVLASPARLLAALTSDLFAKHAGVTGAEFNLGNTARAYVRDVKALQDNADAAWHALDHKFYLLPRGLSIIASIDGVGHAEDAVPAVYALGMHKAFDMNKGGPVPTTAAGAATLRALEQQRAVVAHLTRKANGEMARVARPACLNGAWLFAQKNRAVVANSDADLKAALDKLGNNVAHAVEFGRSFFRLLRKLPPHQADALNETCAQYVLVCEKLGSKLQQHLVREKPEHMRVGLVVFAAVPLDAAEIARAVRARRLPRLGVRATAELCERCGVPYVGLVKPPASLQRFARPSAPPGELCVTSAQDLEDIRRALLTLDQDDLEGAVLVLEDEDTSSSSPYPAIALFKCKVAWYSFRRRLREQMKRIAHPNELVGLEARLKELLVNVPAHRHGALLAQARRCHRWSLSYRAPAEYVDRNILDLLDAHAAAAMETLDRPSKTMLVVEPGCGKAVLLELTAKFPASPVFNAARMGSGFSVDEHVVQWRRDSLYDFLLVTPLQLVGAGAFEVPPGSRANIAAMSARRVLKALSREGESQAGTGVHVHVVESATELADDVKEYLSEDPAEATAMYEFGRDVMRKIAATQPPAGVAVAMHSTSSAALSAIEVHPVPEPLATSGPRRTPLAVFVVGLTGLGKSHLAIDTADELKRRAKPLHAVALDQDVHAKAGSKASSERYLADVRAALDDADVDVLLIHRNGPGSDATIEELHRRGVPFVAALPTDLLPFGPLQPLHLHACLTEVLNRGTDPSETSYVGNARRARTPHPMASTAPANRIETAGLFLRLLVMSVAPTFSRGGQRPLGVSYFEPGPNDAGAAASLPQEHRVALLSWALVVLSRKTLWDKTRTPYDGAVEKAASHALAPPTGVRHAWPRCDPGVAAARFAAAVAARFDTLCAPESDPVAASAYVQLCHDSSARSGTAAGGRYAAVFFPPSERLEGLHITVFHAGLTVSGTQGIDDALIGKQVACSIRHVVEVRWSSCMLRVAPVETMVASDGTDIAALTRSFGGVPHVTIAANGNVDPKLAPLALALAVHAVGDGVHMAPGEAGVPPGDVRVSVEDQRSTLTGTLRWSSAEEEE